jgi:hypothetical protein
MYGVLGGRIGGRIDSLLSRMANDPADLSPEQRRYLVAKLPGFVSFPRTGSHWLNAVMELYFARPCLREGRSTFLETQRTDWMWFHDHDFDLALKHPNVLYIYRDPVDTLYSYLNYKFRASRRASYLGQLVQCRDDAYSSDKVDVAATEYRRHLEKWLLSTLKARTIVRYDLFVHDSVSEFRKICHHFETSTDEGRAKRAFASVSKESLIGVTTKQIVINRKLLTPNYANERKRFRDDFAERIYDLLLTPQLKPFFTPLHQEPRTTAHVSGAAAASR